MKFKGIIKAFENGFKQHSPEILIGLGLGGMVTSIYLSIKVTPKALKLIDEKKKEEEKEKLTAIETVKATWKCYLPVISVASISALCIISGTRTNLKRNAALMSAYTISESAFRDYRSKVIETIGERKEQSIRDSVAEDKLKEHPVSKEVIIVEKGNTLCYDAISGRYFKSDIDKIRKAENEINRRLRQEMTVSLNDFYYEIDLPPIKVGNDLGWNIDKGYLELNLTSKLAADDTPCLVITYDVAPEYA